ncbi:pyocin knob domain-containing protein [Paenarthrobacter nicotinovorans]|uniref:pyocin knob domain-containing protein n=1 Tax=Paenarthrobacter nicotinovorans TaxID=29320 RepID=UPI0011A98C12|nr:pyocin knob domain-containing protein [Paenarthrobacter nicotinovorans]
MTELTYGTVKGRFDDTVAGETVAITGSVTFVAEPDYLLSAETTPKTTILPTPKTVELVDGAFTVELLGTDNASLNPLKWTYRVVFDLAIAGRPYHRAPINISVPSEVVTDLADATPVAASEGNAVVRGLQGETGPVGPASVIPGPQGIRGSRWFYSGAGTPDYFNVANPLEGDIFLYPSSRDFFQYQSGTWVYGGNIGAIKGDTGPQGIQGIQGLQGIQGVKGDPGGIVNPVQLAAGTDWNTVIVSGMYFATGSDMAGMPNSAPSMAIGVNLMVQARTSSVVTQIAWTVSNAQGQIQFQRSLVSGTWGPWRVFRNTVIDQTAGRAIYMWDELNNRSQLIYGDTGVRNISDYLDTSKWSAGIIKLRRFGSEVELRGLALDNVAGVVGTVGTLNATLPYGFRNAHTVTGVGSVGSSLARVVIGFGATNATIIGVTDSVICDFTVKWQTTDAWPTSLPGAADGGIPNL